MTITKQLDDNQYTTNNAYNEQDIPVLVNDTTTPVHSNAHVGAPLTTATSIGNDKHSYSKSNPARTTTATTTTTITHIPPPSNNIQHPDLAAMKRERVRNQCLGGWVGGAVGLLVFSIPGAIIGAIAGNKITKLHLKKEERKVQQDYEFRVSQQQQSVNGASSTVSSVGSSSAAQEETTPVAHAEVA